MTTAQAATKLGISTRTVRRWAAAELAGQGNGKLAAVHKDERGHWVITLPADVIDLGAFAARHGASLTADAPSSALSLAARGRLALRGF